MFKKKLGLDNIDYDESYFEFQNSEVLYQIKIFN